MRNIAIVIAFALTAGCTAPRIVDDPQIADQFTKLGHPDPRPGDGFEARLKQLLPQGLPAARCQTLLSRANRVITKSGMTMYAFDPPSQGLFVYIYVDSESNTIAKVEWGVAGK